MSTDAGLTCPKCGSEWRSYERNSVTVDQCSGCRGVFLDRGELERLIDAEGNYYERESSAPRDERGDHGGQKPKKSRKRSFLESILEAGGE